MSVSRVCPDSLGRPAEIGSYSERIVGTISVRRSASHVLKYMVVAGEFVKMKDSTKDKIEGGAHQMKGAVKEKVGRAIKKPNLEIEGADEKLGGKIQNKAGDIEKVFDM
jgi:uncharacterized protein YjbJ (UPF0337 family)